MPGPPGDLSEDLPRRGTQGIPLWWQRASRMTEAHSRRSSQRLTRRGRWTKSCWPRVMFFGLAGTNSLIPRRLRTPKATPPATVSGPHWLSTRRRPSLCVGPSHWHWYRREGTLIISCPPLSPGSISPQLGLAPDNYGRSSTDRGKRSRDSVIRKNDVDY